MPGNVEEAQNLRVVNGLAKMSELWLTEFESRLERLERSTASNELPFAELSAMADAAVGALAVGSRLRYLLARPDSVEVIAQDGRSEALPSSEHPVIMDAAGRDFLIEANSSIDGGSKTGASTLYMPARLADQLTLVVQVDYESLHCPQSGFIEGSRAVSDMVASYVSRHLLSQYESRLQGQAGLTDIVARLHQATSLRTAANVIAQDGAAILGKCRLSVLAEKDGTFRVQAVTGVSTPDRGSESVRALESLTESFRKPQTSNGPADSTSDQWLALESPDSSSGENTAAALRTLKSHGTKKLRVIPLTAAASGGTENWQDARIAVLIEQYDDSVVLDEGMMAQLLQAARQPLEHHLEKQRSFVSRIVTSRTKRWMLAVGIAALLLVAYPAKFEVEVPGQVVSANQRHVFAPEDGTIDEVLFSNESFVAANSTLLKMSNADMELQLQQLQGEIDTTESQLTAARMGRVTGIDMAINGDEVLLDKRLENLQKQRQLLIEQSLALQIKAPFSGTVYRPDPQQELQSRPVQRGQRLLEIVPEDPAWQLRLAIPSHLLSYVTQRRNESDEPLSVRYMIWSAPENDWHTSLTSVENAVQIENGDAVCHAVAELKDVPNVDLRPGTSVSARISCGRRPLGFVLFREVLEFLRQLRFAWF